MEVLIFAMSLEHETVRLEGHVEIIKEGWFEV